MTTQTAPVSRRNAVMMALRGLLPTLLTMFWGFLALAAAALPYLLFNAALPAAGVLRAVGYKLLITVFGILLSFFLLGERPALQVLLGAAVVIAGLFLIQRSRSAR